MSGYRLVIQTPPGSAGSWASWRFLQSLDPHAAQHSTVLLYGDGVWHTSPSSQPRPQQPHWQQQWSTWAATHAVQVLCCATSLAIRGLTTLPPGLTRSSLLALHASEPTPWVHAGPHRAHLCHLDPPTLIVHLDQVRLEEEPMFEVIDWLVACSSLDQPCACYVSGHTAQQWARHLAQVPAAHDPATQACHMLAALPAYGVTCRVEGEVLAQASLPGWATGRPPREALRF